jgi:GWxTD domain-containing protein
LTPNPARSFGDELQRFASSGEVVDNRPAGSPDSMFQLSFRILNELQAVAAHGDTAIARRGPRTPFLIRPALGPLEPGVYRFVLELTKPLITTKGQKKATPIRREKSFTVVPSAASATLDLKTALEVLRYIATDAELAEMDRLQTPEDRRAFWEAFWHRRDPDPETPRNDAMEEFYKRVRYADQRFGVGGPGWKTDMGKIYIQFGQPDEIVRNPFRFDGPPEEIWYYYQSRRTYVFVDRDGFGRYELDAERTR